MLRLVIIVLHLSKPFLKHLEFRTYKGYNGHHSRNFYCRVWSRIKILVSSCKSYDHMSPFEGQVHHLDYMSYIYHACTGMKNRFPHPRSTTLDWKRWEMKKGVREGLIVKRKKGEVARLTSAWASTVCKKEERECLHSLLWKHRLSTSNWSCSSHFSVMNSSINCLQSSTNDDLFSGSAALLIVVESLNIFQEHLIAASFLCPVQWFSFQSSLLWTPFRSSRC